jgi:hypothetical protein
MVVNGVSTSNSLDLVMSDLALSGFSPLLVLFHQQHMRQQHNKYEVHHKQEVQIGLPSGRRLSVAFRPLLVQVLSEASCTYKWVRFLTNPQSIFKEL